MKLKLKPYVPGKQVYKPSYLQKKQWAQFAAIGYSMAIRGYLHCWMRLLQNAGFPKADLDRIADMIDLAKVCEKRARWNMRHLRIL